MWWNTKGVVAERYQGDCNCYASPNWVNNSFLKTHFIAFLRLYWSFLQLNLSSYLQFMPKLLPTGKKGPRGPQDTADAVRAGSPRTQGEAKCRWTKPCNCWTPLGWGRRWQILAAGAGANLVLQPATSQTHNCSQLRTRRCQHLSLVTKFTCLLVTLQITC